MTETSTDKIRILLVDDHSLFREGIMRLLTAEEDLDVVAQCSTVSEAAELLRNTEVDLILLDYDLYGRPGSELFYYLHELAFDGKVLVVTAGVSDPVRRDLFEEGIAGIFHKHDPPSMLAGAIRDVVAGKPLESPPPIALRADVYAEQEKPPRLTQREGEVLRAVFEGLANKEIADRLEISESSVKAGLQQLFQKTGVRTRGQLVRIALERFRDQI
jgi:DNA-binding NarL/FixJ family response regulator